ncbi:MAG: DegT/DnrJ/EryC1/StrS family aminotransferase [Anaerolinea sp.]|nr:DegT/DnrJ/EryC1/StrS family aminotransferase [Anaerolinea sp.]
MELIPWAKPNLWGNEQKYISEALESTWISGGPFVERFERDFEEFSNVRFALATSNGTTALHLAYLGLGLGDGDEVIVPGFAFMAAANMAINIGALPIFAEVDPDTWCVTANTIEKCISPRTKAIVPIHTYGNVCEMDNILALAIKHKIPVIEDAAEAFTSRYKGKLAGTMADLGTYSFQATKTITTGEGGMVTTENEELNHKMILHRSHGMLRKTFYWHEVPGQNFRLTNLQAALGVAQLEKLDSIISGRKKVCASYAELLSDIDGFRLQYFPPEVDGLPWAIALKLDKKAFPQGRDTVLQQMRDFNIETRPGFYAANLMKHIYSNAQSMPVSEETSRQVISLPTYPTLRDEQVEYISSKLIGLKR